jgi:hypothetical protein
MASLASSRRNLLGREQPSTSSTPDTIARFDGMNETSPELHRATSWETANHGASTTKNGPSPHLTGQHEFARQDYALQPSNSHQVAQPAHRFAVQQGKQPHARIPNINRPPQELGNGGFSQYDDWTWQVHSRAATAQPPETLQYDVHINDQPYASQLLDKNANTRAEEQVKQEPAVHEQDNQDIFAEFTNEDVHKIVARASDETQEVVELAYHDASDPPSIQQEPESESRPFTEAVAQAERVELTVKPTTMMEQTQEVSTNFAPQITSKNAATTSRAGAELAHLEPQVSSTLATPTYGTQQQDSFEQNAQVPEQSIAEFELQLGNGKILLSPSIDSVIGAQRHSSEETASSRGGMDLAANSQLAMQWQGRQNLLCNVGLTADAVHMASVLLHGPRPAKDQSVARPATAMHQPRVLSNCSVRPPDGMHHSSTFPYNSNSMHTISPVATQYGQVQTPWMNPGWSYEAAPSQAFLSAKSLTRGGLPQGSMSSQRTTEAQEEGVTEVSDNDEPLVTRAPCHRSTTASPMPARAHLPNGLGSKAGIDAAAPVSSLENVKQDSVIELSDDDDEEAAAAISWKLPDFEVTYHPPATDKNLPMAKVSILGAKENLVRREVCLTEDHAHDEMELFLNVFLPAQQALQTPDPEPAHAVINFHTISVMVLETFVQYEIGDEMGRGYGFHGGNISSQVRRPSPSSSDEEPTRTRSGQDADVDEIFFAVIDRWRAGLISGKGTLKLIRGCQEFCEIALDVIHYVKEHGLSQPKPKKRKERSDKGIKRGPQGGAKETAAKGKATGKRKADTVEGKVPAKKTNVNELTGRKKAKNEVKKTKPKPKAKSSGITVTKK